ncbi:alcohol dehydrogenase [Vararia minispora EC-137]|uniref:Alcohol dehydrogenase n=1 Tax=Vararia minispora EC-137 TaxID=1314806 RepID=A0ACB8QW80_9AGAM|nr:alcohol dehydrogenase [Vararia minispora EC-137]
MAPVRNARYIFTEVPEEYPEPGRHFRYDDSQIVDLESVSLDGGILVKTLVLSLDPYMRGRMRPPSKESYTNPFRIGESLSGYGVGVILRSEHEAYALGDHVTYVDIPHQEYFVVKPNPFLRKIPSDAGVPWSLFIGVLGMPGQTAYASWKEYAKPQKGQTVFVSTAAGAVGSFVVQLAKLDGMKVIASSGSDEKAAFTKECGADVSFNYKTTSTEEILQKEGPIDVYYDNVGGETLDLAFKYAAKNARFIECGMISIYNKPDKSYPFKHLMEIIGKQISVNGFLVFDLVPKWGKQFYEEMPRLVKEGKIKFQEDRSYGLDQIGEAFVAVQKGTNNGKKVVVVAED